MILATAVFFALCEMSWFPSAFAKLRRDKSVFVFVGDEVTRLTSNPGFGFLVRDSSRRLLRFWSTLASQTVWASQSSTLRTAHPNTLIQRHATANVGRDVEVFTLVNCRLAFVKPPLGNNRQRQLCLEHLGTGFSRPATGLFGQPRKRSGFALLHRQ